MKNINNNDIALKLYESMFRIRSVEEAIAEKYTEWKMRCPTHLSIGQEAVAAAVGLVLNKDDFAVSTHRSHAHYIGKGGGIKEMIAEIYGKETGCSGGRGGSMHLIDESVGFKGSTAIVGNTIPIGVGLGLSIQLRNTQQISCIYLGDGSVEEGVFYESVNYAAVRNLPVLFVCENNLYSVYSSLEARQPKNRKIHEMVDAIGIASSEGNGNDVLEVYDTIDEIASKIRKTGSPHFAEFSTYRWREHCGPNYDNDIGYRTEEEFLSWKQQDPIRLFEEKLKSDYLVTDQEINIIQNNIFDEIEKAFEYAESSEYPDKSTMYNHIYK